MADRDRMTLFLPDQQVKAAKDLAAELALDVADLNRQIFTAGLLWAQQTLAPSMRRAAARAGAPPKAREIARGLVRDAVGGGTAPAGAAGGPAKSEGRQLVEQARGNLRK